VLPALLIAAAPSQLVLEGGTHNPNAPPYDFLVQTFLPLLARMGPRVSARLARPGFYPAGGGVIEVQVEPAPLKPLVLTERGAVLEQRAAAVVANLPDHIARRELAVLGAELRLPSACLEVRHEETARGPGNVVTVSVRSGYLTETFHGFGERGVAAETVARRVAAAVRRYLAAGVPVGEHLADQLLLPLALAGGGSFTTLTPSAHTRSNGAVIETFMDVRVNYTELAPDVWKVEVCGLG
jgi:RNA 3'-terminal phosphate cyclase (ATP)